MSKEYTTCRVKHRDYVPWNWIAVEFCHVDFMGKDAKLYENEWHDIEFKKYDKREKEIEDIEKEIEFLTKDINNTLSLTEEIEKEIKELRKKLPILKRLFKCYTSEIKEKENKLIIQLERIEYNINRRKNLIHKKEELDEDRFYSQSELMCKIEKYLENNGFRIINSSQSGNECVTRTDIWQKDYND